MSPARPPPAPVVCEVPPAPELVAEVTLVVLVVLVSSDPDEHPFASAATNEQASKARKDCVRAIR